MAFLSRDEILRRLVGFDTVSQRSNLELIRFVADLLDDQGVAVELTYDDSREKANLFAHIGPTHIPGVLLSGHTDVVPVEGQAWTTDPFRLCEKNGCYYGRGSADMKGFVACALDLVLSTLREGAHSSLEVPLQLAFSYDEEVGCRGVPRLISALPSSRPKPRAVWVGEPTMMRIVDAHKGIFAFRSEFHGCAGHSSAPEKGASAIVAAAHFADTVAAIGQQWRAEQDPTFSPPFSTFNLGRIGGGTALNIIPEAAQIDWEVRPLPGAQREKILAALEERFRNGLEERSTAKGVRWTTESLAHAPGLRRDPESVASELVAKWADAGPGRGAVSFATEAGLFQGAGMSAVVCGPGSIDQAHRPDEFVSMEQLNRASEALGRLRAWALAGEQSPY